MKVSGDKILGVMMGSLGFLSSPGSSTGPGRGCNPFISEKISAGACEGIYG